jgi:hypothetical protein
VSTVDCPDVLTALARGLELDAALERHRASCADCAMQSAGIGAVARAIAALPAVSPPPDIDERVLRAAASLLADNARAAAPLLAEHARVATLDGRSLVRALVPAVLLFPLLVVADVWLLRMLHQTLAAILPGALTTWLVLSYAALLAALGCFVFGAIPLLVERQAPLLGWKEEHVRP